MSQPTLQTTDGSLDAVMEALARHKQTHPLSEIDGYRQNSVSIRIRIVDPDFAGVSKAERHNAVWQMLDELPEDIQSQLSTLLLLTPEEKVTSFASFDFDHPIPSNL